MSVYFPGRRAFRYFMPYVVIKMGEREWLMLNRDYKPLGQTSQDFVRYEDYAHQFVRFTRHPSKMKGVWQWPGISNDRLSRCTPEATDWYLYGDGRESQQDYFTRLERLMRYSRQTHEWKPERST